ncbi:hypothetical protein LI90_2817 [Carbonactinospora thermoautotrophica]|uniref:Peptidase S8/S53 domain-containing protein n=2 Tax=Carbonactinospora thermoautotrophica TaxID=1469144 RepID=A0A132MV61_9ACTN|nr:S8 family peptidase [Carbonactinospora thermoautotrophica]KWX01785.1 hypothetical protein LI90_2817 [Carbonactinospora thermoautotrophica]
MRSRVTAAVTMVVTAALVMTGFAPAATAPDPRPAPAGTPPLTVTLVTGDRVTAARTAHGVQVLGVDPGPGRDHVMFTRARLGDHEHVYPADALPLVEAARLDRRLFDVTGLVEQGYDDASRADLPLIIQHARQARTLPYGTQLTATFGRLGMSAVSVRKRDTGGVWRQLTGGPYALYRGDNVAAVWLDGQVRATLDESVRQIGADRAHVAGVTGAGVPVAVLDTGYDPGHPDLAEAVVGSKDFTTDGTVADGHGHGTHVASIVAGRGTASGGQYTGVAPGAKLLVGKVLTRQGTGRESWVLAGMEWAVTAGARIVNMSLGGPPTDGTDPLSRAVDELTRRTGALFVVAAGNRGAPESVGVPGAATEALTVGSVDKDGDLSSFSSRGPRLGDRAVKPDLVAPGGGIVAARAAGTLQEWAVTDRYARLSGTSMATPHVAGAAALLVQRHPDWRAPQLKAALVGSAAPIAQGSVFDQGAGLLDVAAAIRTPLRVEPANLGAAHLAWPLEQAKPTAWTVTYRNDGSQPLRLHLTAVARGADGAPAPAGLVTLSATQLTIPAGGTGAVAVRVDPAHAAPGWYGGVIEARDEATASTTVRTTFSAFAEGPSHTLTLVRAPRAGTAERAFAHVVVQQEETGATKLVSVGETPQTHRLPAGTYRIFGYRHEEHFADGVLTDQTVVHFAHRIRLDRDTTLVPDAGPRLPVTTTVDAPGLRLRTSGTGIVSRLPSGRGFGLLAPIFATGRHRVEAIGSGRIDGLLFFHTAAWQQPLLTATAAGEPSLELDVRPVGPGFHGKVTGQVVDVRAGTPQDLGGKDLRGRIVLVTPGWDTPQPEQAARLAAIAACEPALILLAEGTAAVQKTPVLQLGTASLRALRHRLAAGPVEVTVQGLRASTDTWFLAHTVDGRVPASAAWSDRAADLAVVRARFGAIGLEERTRPLLAVAERDGVTLRGVTADVRLPQEQTLRYTPDLTWTTRTYHELLNEDGVEYYVGEAGDGPVRYRRGEQRTEDWLTGPYGPSLAVTPLDPGTGQRLPAVHRRGDRVVVTLPLLADAYGHLTRNQPRIDRGATVLTMAGGIPIGRNDVPGQGVFAVPGQTATYRLTTTVRRTHPTWQLSTEVRDTWVFRSGRTSWPEALPLLDIKYALPYGPAPAGQPYAFDVTATHQPGAWPAQVIGVHVWWSTDDGATWWPAWVAARDGRWTVTVPNPKKGFVSLRTWAVDAAGGQAAETIIRAYRVS